MIDTEKQKFICYRNTISDSLLFIRRGSSEDDHDTSGDLELLELQGNSYDFAKMLYPNLADKFIVWEQYSKPLLGDRYLVSSRSHARYLEQWYDSYTGWGSPMENQRPV